MLKSQVSYMTWHIWFFHLLCCASFTRNSAVPHYFKNQWKIKLEVVKRNKNEFDVQMTVHRDIFL